MLKRKRLLFFIVIILIALAIAAWFFRKQAVQKRVLTDPIRRGTVIESIYGIGTVKANKIYDLKSGVISSIDHVYVKEGDFVEKGARLVDFREGAHFVAPFAGTVTWVPYNAGENVFLQSVIVRVVDLKDRYMVVSLEQRGAIKVKSGQKARINFDNLRNETYNGVVEAVYSHENDFMVRIRVSDLPDQILPGMTGDVAIGIREYPNVLVIPVAAIDNGKVEVQRGRRKVTVPVTTGIVDGAMAQVVSGDLSEGDRLMMPKRKSQ
jgi:multidrug efflux pump subunit AcrA (membrane-fusion protein)